MRNILTADMIDKQNQSDERTKNEVRTTYLNSEYFNHMTAMPRPSCSFPLSLKCQCVEQSAH